MTLAESQLNIGRGLNDIVTVEIDLLELIEALI